MEDGLPGVSGRRAVQPAVAVSKGERETAAAPLQPTEGNRVWEMLKISESVLFAHAQVQSQVICLK